MLRRFFVFYLISSAARYSTHQLKKKLPLLSLPAVVNILKHSISYYDSAGRKPKAMLEGLARWLQDEADNRLRDYPLSLSLLLFENVVVLFVFFLNRQFVFRNEGQKRKEKTIGTCGIR